MSVSSEAATHGPAQTQAKDQVMNEYLIACAAGKNIAKEQDMKAERYLGAMEIADKLGYSRNSEG